MEINFKELANNWFNEKKTTNVKPSTLSSYYTIAFKGLIPYFNGKEINNKTIQDYVLYCTHEKMYSKRTVVDHLKLLKIILKDFIHEKEFNVDFPTVLEMRQNQNSSFNISDINKLREHVVRNINNQYCFAIFLSLSLGLRMGEVLGLKFSDFDFVNKKINISRTSQRIQVFSEDNFINPKSKLVLGSPKTKSSKRSLPVTDFILDTVNWYAHNRDKEECIFKPVVKKTNDPLENRVLREAFYRILKELNIPKLTFHSLRHSFASNCNAAKINVKTTAAMLGHSNIKITLDVYTHPTFEQKKDAVSKLSKLFS